jgi:hypothetical protein
MAMKTKVHAIATDGSLTAAEMSAIREMHEQTNEPSVLLAFRRDGKLVFKLNPNKDDLTSHD